MIDYLNKFEMYLDKIKKRDISRVFSQNIAFHEFLHLKIIDIHSKRSEDESVQVSELVESAGVSAQAVSKCLKALEAKEYIVRFTNKSDRRITQVKLTDYGKKVFDITQEEIHEVMTRVFAEFTKAEYEMLDNLTSKFLALYEKTIDEMKIGG